MNYNKKTVRDIDVKGKKVLLRCDFNVPMAKDGSGVITDDKRIQAALPTIQYLLDQGAAVIACSHMGKPKGEVKPELSLKPVAKRFLYQCCESECIRCPSNITGSVRRSIFPSGSSYGRRCPPGVSL